MAVCGCIKLIIILLYLKISHAQYSKLNVPRILLPIFENFRTNFTLEVFDTRCYKWSISRTDVAQLIPPRSQGFISDCSTSVTVSTLSKELVRNTVVVFAEEKRSGFVLRCDVIVSIIDSLVIVTTTKELYVEEAPEAFEVRAYDSQGNEFTTLEGVEFQWSISSRSSSSSNDDGILRLITFKDSPYEVPSTVQQLDIHGKYGHMVLLEGIRTGSAKVSVRLPHPEYQHVPAAEINLTVIDSLIIDPGDLYLMKGDSVQYHILKVHNGRLKEMPFPSNRYHLKIQDPEVAHINTETAVVTGIKNGKTSIFLYSHELEEDEAGIDIPTAALTVDDPCYLSLTILPHHNWILMIEEHYEIAVEIYDSDNHKFYIGAGVYVSVSIPEKYFHVSNRTNNHTHFYGWPIEVGTTEVTATLKGVRDSSGKRQAAPRISAVADMLIYDKITITPSEVLLPWDPVIQPKYDVQLKASGGDGKFSWNSDNTTIADVNEDGVVKTQAHGNVQISAAMTLNLQNYEKMNIHILPASHLEIVQYTLEAEIGVPIYLHIAVFADKIINSDSENQTKIRVPFTHCSDLPLIVKVWNNIFRNSSLKITPLGISCTSVAIIGTHLGTSKVTVSYTFQGHTMTDSVLVATYKPLVVTHPITRESILAIGTSREVVFSGGPRPWKGQSSEHMHKITFIGDAKSVEVMELTEKFPDLSDFYVYRILCRALGEVNVTLTVTNLPSVRHCTKSESIATIITKCSKPRHISLSPMLKTVNESTCPMKLGSQEFLTYNYRDIELYLTVKDDHGNLFDNITSLYFDWKLSHPSLASVEAKGAVMEKNIQEGTVTLPHKSYQLIKPKFRTGVLKVTVTIDGYQEYVTMLYDLTSENLPCDVVSEAGYNGAPSATLSLILINDTTVTPNQMSIFNHPQNIVRLQVNRGSGYSEFVLNTEELADVNYVDSRRVIEIIPKMDGKLKIALVDLCLQSKPAVSEIHILDIGSIKVEVPENIERGKCVTAIIHLYDTAENPVPIPSLEFLDLHPVPELGIIGINMVQEKDLIFPLKEMRYVITGLELGETKLKFISGKGHKEIRSQIIPIQVFPPLKLFPCNVTLLVGSSFQISYRGGPQPDAQIQYSIASPDIAKISSSGVVFAYKEGTTTITGKAVGVNKVTGQQEVYSHDSVDIHIISLKGIKIFAPLLRLKTGSTMPVWAQGMPDMLTPLILGSLQPALKFIWSVSTKDVATVNHSYHSLGMNVKEEDMVSMHFTAKSPGITFLRLQVKAPSFMISESSKVEFRDILEIEVYEELLVVHPPYLLSQQSQLIVLSPNSEVQLKTNHDHIGKNLIYSLGGDMLPTELNSDQDEEYADKPLQKSELLITVESNGLIRSYNQLGRTAITVVATEDFGIKQIHSITIEVKQIHYIMLNARKKIQVEDEHILELLPQGFELQFKVSYHDKSGSPFTATGSNIKLRTNRFDLVQLRSGETNNSLTAKLMNPGHTMLKVWDESTPQQAADYVMLTAGEIIFPQETKELLQTETLTVGDIVCFSMPLRTEDYVRGTWETDNKNVVTLDPILGTGKVKECGKVIIKHYLASVFTFTELEAYQISSITFLKPSNEILINNNLMPPFRVPIVLKNLMSPNKVGNLITRNGSCHVDYKVPAFPFVCELRFDSPIADVEVEEVFAVHQDFNTSTGTYECVIISSGTPTLKKSVLHTNFTLHVFSKNEILSKPLKIPFLPIVHVHSQQINLSEITMGSYIAVSGRHDVLKDLSVVPLNPDYLMVGGPEKTEKTKVFYKVQLTDKYWQEADLTTPMSVSIISEATFQNIQIPVNIRLVGGSSLAHGPCAKSRWGFPISDTVYYYRSFFSVLGTIIVITIMSLYVYLYFFRPSLPPIPPYPMPMSTPRLISRASLQDGGLYYSSSSGPYASTAHLPLLQKASALQVLSRPSLAHMRRSSAQMSQTMEPVFGDPLLYQSPTNLLDMRSRSVMHQPLH